MEAKNRDETRQRRREEALVRRLGEAFDRMGPQGGGECPDSERIAAYYERALAPQETAQWEGHFAACARCRKILAVLAASAEAPLADHEVERLGVLASATQAKPHRIQGAKPERTSGFHRRLRWLVPAFGAAALVLWFAVWPPWRTSKDVQSVELIDITPRPPLQNSEVTPAPPGNPASAVLNGPARAVAPTSKAKDSQAAKSQAPKAGLDGLVALDNAVNGRVALPDQVAGRAGKTAPAREAAEDAKTGRTESSGGVGGAAATGTLGALSPTAPTPAAPPRPAFAASSAQAEVGVLQKQSAPAARAAANATPKAAPAPENQPPEQGGARVMNTAPLIALSQVGRPWSLLFKLPSSGAMWHMENDGRIERSDDGGQTWKLQANALQGDWLHGAVVSSTVWWLAGRDGAIARTRDGEHWERIAPPALAADASGKQPDWVSIVATDGQTATIARWDGQQYTTHDGGKSWQKQ
jgi:hypothetical protein